MELFSPTLVAVVGLIVVVVLLAALITTRYKVAGPNEAFIVTGRKGNTKTPPPMTTF